ARSGERPDLLVRVGGCGSEPEDERVGRGGPVGRRETDGRGQKRPTREVAQRTITGTFLYVSLAMDPISTTPGRQSQVLNSSYFTPGRKSHKKRPRTAVLDGRRVLATSVASEIVSPKRYSRSAQISHLR